MGREYHCEPVPQGIKLFPLGSGAPRKVAMLVKLQSAISLFTCGCLVSVAASPSSIGFVVDERPGTGRWSRRARQLDTVSGECGADRKCDLRSHVSRRLQSTPAAGLNGHGFRDSGVLEHGAAVQRGPHTLFADGLKVSSLSPQGAVLVDMQDRSHIKVDRSGRIRRGSQSSRDGSWLDWSRARH